MTQGETQPEGLAERDAAEPEDADSWEESEGARFLRYGLTVLAAALAVFLLTAHTFKWGAVQVDSNSLILLAIIVAIPLASYIRRFKVGDFEAEFYALKRKTKDLERKQADVTRIVVDRASRQDSEGVVEETTVAGDSRHAEKSSRDIISDLWRTAGGSVPKQRIRNLLWVDDNPQSVSIERSILERRGLVVTTAASTKEAVGYLNSAEFDVVVTDLVRREDGRVNYEAGAHLIAVIRNSGKTVPIIVFSSEESLSIQRDSLRTLGVDRSTASFSELEEWLSLASAVGFETEVMDRLRAHFGESGHPQDQSESGVDWIAALPSGRRVGFEIRAWHQSPGIGALRRVIKALDFTRHQRDLTLTVLVTPVGLPAQAVSLLDENDVRVVSISELDALLRALDRDDDVPFDRTWRGR